jgi:hypothetical protein
MRIIVLRSARRAIADGIQFYEDQESGLGAYFLDSIMADIRSLKIYAGVHQVFDDRYYRMTCRTFPCSIYYRIENSDVKVYAVLDDRRDPEWIRSRLN